MNGASSHFDVRHLGVAEILDSLADGVYVTDSDRRIVFWNRAAERITGWAAEDVLGRRCRDNILVHVDKDGHQLCGKSHCPLYRAMVTGETSTTPFLLFARTREGARLPVEVSVAPLRDAAAGVVGAIEVFRDRTATFQDFQRAAVIQMHAMGSVPAPEARVRFACRYTPHGIVGGDFYRAERVVADRYAVLVADVMGHGLPAALYTMQIRSLWEDLKTEWTHPATFVAALNEHLTVLTSPNNHFATAVYVLVNARNGKIAYVNAGGPAPLLFRDDGTVQELSVVGTGLGFLRDVQYTEGRSAIPPGGTLLVYTDGAVEITNETGAPLGAVGFVEMLTRHGFHQGRATLDHIEEHLLDYCAEIRLPDDLTLFAACRPV